jgi:hypothetical protein
VGYSTCDRSRRVRLSEILDILEGCVLLAAIGVARARESRDLRFSDRFIAELARHPGRVSQLVCDRGRLNEHALLRRNAL